MITTNNVTTAYDAEYQAKLLAVETDVEMAAGVLCIEAFSGEPGISGARRVFDLLENPTNSVSMLLSFNTVGKFVDLYTMNLGRGITLISNSKFNRLSTIKISLAAKGWARSFPCLASPTRKSSSCQLVSIRATAFWWF